MELATCGSVEAVQDSEIVEADVAVAVKFAGTDGGVVSGSGKVVALVLVERAETLPAASNAETA